MQSLSVEEELKLPQNLWQPLRSAWGKGGCPVGEERLWLGGTTRDRIGCSLVVVFQDLCWRKRETNSFLGKESHLHQ
jgi:hypothetical protein